MDVYFGHDQQLTIIANWILGRHREDIPLLSASIFEHHNLYAAAIVGEKTFPQLMAESKTDGVTLTELYKAANPDGLDGSFSEAAYLEAKTNALLYESEKLKHQLTLPGADIPAICSKLVEIQAIIEERETKPAAASLSANFLKAIESEGATDRIRYGKGFEDLDKSTGGMKRGQLIVLAARPGTGKSAASLQIAWNVVAKGLKILFFPLEMTTQETLERLVLQRQIVDSQSALRALRSDEREKVKIFLDGVEKAGTFLIYEGVNNLEAISQIIKEQRPDFVVVDQLTQVRTARKTKDIRERYAEVTAELKHIAIEFKTTILLLTQLNRASTDQAEPTLENLHESDATGQNADQVILMWSKEKEDGAPLEDIYLKVVKNRGGKTGGYVRCKYQGERFTFSGTAKGYK